jgi:hypothetical protein
MGISNPKKTVGATQLGHLLSKRMDNRNQVPPNKVPATSPMPVRASPTSQAFRGDWKKFVRTLAATE